MKALLFAFLPDQFLPLVILAIAFGLVLGLINRKVAMGYMGLLILFVVLSPFIDSLFSSLPLWLLIVITFALFLSMGRLILSSLFGKGATDHFVGSLMFACFMLPFKALRYLLRGRR